jgi:steroid 5-alpha reductase family enzyme
MQSAGPGVRQSSKRESANPGQVLVSVPVLFGCLCAASFTGLWARQIRTRNATSVDAAWAIAIGVLGLASAVFGDGAPLQRWLAAAIVGLWSGRLSWHLVVHRVLGHAHEDGRYRAMREYWRETAQFRFFCFYQAQAVAALVFALPFWLLSQHPVPHLVTGQWLGLAIVVVSQALEGAADRQLERHRGDPAQRGRTCRTGLWRYSRHPNYFFEWTTWCGIALVAAPAAGWLATIQPAVMFVLVRFVSGVPFTELQSLKSRGDDYRRYQQETNTFVPWWPHARSEP